MRYVIACVLAAVVACGLSFAGRMALADTTVMPGAAPEMGPLPTWVAEEGAKAEVPPLDPESPSTGLDAVIDAHAAGQMLAAGLLAVWTLMVLLKRFAAARKKTSKLRQFFEKRWVLWASNALISIAATIAGKMVIGEHVTWMAAAVIALGVFAGSSTGYSMVQDKKEG